MKPGDPQDIVLEIIKWGLIIAIASTIVYGISQLF